jgi:hypothetical protein
MIQLSITHLDTKTSGKPHAFTVKNKVFSEDNEKEHPKHAKLG